MFRNLDTAVLQDLLTDAHRLGHAAAVATLEHELGGRGVFHGVASEPPFPLTFIRDETRRREIALARLRDAAAHGDAEWFDANLLIHGDNFAEVWQLTRSFDVEQRAALLGRLVFWLATAIHGVAEAHRIIDQATDGKSAPEIVTTFDRDFALTFEARSEVQDA